MQRMTNTACPFCGQGLLYRILIRRINLHSYICDECDTVWLRYEDVSNRSGAFANYLLEWMGADIDYLAEFDYQEVVVWPPMEEP